MAMLTNTYTKKVSVSAPANSRPKVLFARDDRTSPRAMRHHVQAEQHQHANESQLLADHRDDEIRLALRQKFQMALGAFKEPFALQPPRADGGGGLNDVPPRTQRIAFRVEQRQNRCRW